MACVVAGVLLVLVAAVVLLSKFTILFEDPFSFATVVLAVAVVGAVACAREARRSFT